MCSDNSFALVTKPAERTAIGIAVAETGAVTCCGTSLLHTKIVIDVFATTPVVRTRHRLVTAAIASTQLGGDRALVRAD